MLEEFFSYVENVEENICYKTLQLQDKYNVLEKYNRRKPITFSIYIISMSTNTLSTNPPLCGCRP